VSGIATAPAMKKMTAELTEQREFRSQTMKELKLPMDNNQKSHNIENHDKASMQHCHPKCN